MRAPLISQLDEQALIVPPGIFDLHMQIEKYFHIHFTFKVSSRWNYRIQLGASVWLPSGEADLQIGAMSMPVQMPTLNLLLGVTFDIE